MYRTLARGGVELYRVIMAELAEPSAEIRQFYAAAGVAQYGDKLVDEGFDTVANVLALDELGLQTLQSAVNMKTGHLATLRAKIGQEAPLGVPLRVVAAPLPAAAATPSPRWAAGKKVLEYTASAGDDIAAMASAFETKYKQQQYGNCMETYTNSKTLANLYEFIGRSTNAKPVNQPVFNCACSPTTIRLAGQYGQNAESHLTRKEHWQYYRHVSFGEPLKQVNMAAWLTFQAGNKKSMSHQNTSQYKRRRQVTDAKRIIADDFLGEEANKAPRPPQPTATTPPQAAATHAVPTQEVEGDDALSGNDAHLFGEEAVAEDPGGAATEGPIPAAAAATPLDEMAAWAAGLAPTGYVQAGNGSL